MKNINFEIITVRKKITSRGGGMEVSLQSLGFPGVLMSASQNYLGGGMLAKITAHCNAEDWKKNEKLLEIAEKLKKYFHGLTNPDTEWESTNYENNQNMPVSGY